MHLPFDAADDEEPAQLLAFPGLENVARERRILEHILEHARRASGGERKLAALDRLLRRHSGPALVFTEYRDTLERIMSRISRSDVVAVHGGMTHSERRAALHAFTHGSAHVLLATDAASEGLNLHQRCRRVINIELPWTPVRLEQRIGRVDRIGQTRKVHAVHLVAGATSEEEIVARLLMRISRARAAMTPGPSGDDRTIVASILGTPDEAAGPAAGVAGAPNIVRPALRETAEREAVRLLDARRLEARAQTAPPNARPVLARLRGDGRRRLWAVRLALADEDGRLHWTTLTGVSMTRAAPADDIRAALDVSFWKHLDLASLPAITSATTAAAHLADRARQRESDIVEGLRTQRARLAPVERGLFERRHERTAAAREAVLAEALARCERQLAAIARLRGATPCAPELAFAAIVG